MAFQIAFYKGTRPGVSGWYNRLVRWWERGKYSHCELVFSDGAAASASLMDGGVRFKQIDFDSGHWDFITLPAGMEHVARSWFIRNCFKPYDLWGQLRFIFSPVREERDAYWCSEAVATALGMAEPWRYGPNSLWAALIFIDVAATLRQQEAPCIRTL